MSEKLPYWEHLLDYIKSSQEKGCACMGCDMGGAGPGVEGEHDVDWFLLETKKYIESIRSTPKADAGLVEAENCQMNPMRIPADVFLALKWYADKKNYEIKENILGRIPGRGPISQAQLNRGIYARKALSILYSAHSLAMFPADVFFKYADHTSICPSREVGLECKCGLDELLASLHGKDGGVE